MDLLIKINKITAFEGAMFAQKIYIQDRVKELDGLHYIVSIDIKTIREALSVGRWIGKNCSADEAIVLGSASPLPPQRSVIKG